MKVGVVVFPGSNCDHDTYHVLKHVVGQDARFVWHKDSDLRGLDAVVLPGGFSYGDYLRTGAIARFSPVMQAVQDFARRGGPDLAPAAAFLELRFAASWTLRSLLMRKPKLVDPALFRRLAAD